MKRMVFKNKYSRVVSCFLLNGVVVMKAEHYFKSTATDKTSWAVIPDLGRTLSGIALLSYTESTDGA